MKPAAVIAVALLGATGAAAQESGWRYSPYPGEGDRAALGCSYGSSPAAHSCVAVRCEDDFSVAIHIDTTRPGGDAGNWTLTIDDRDYLVTAAPVPGSAYGAKVDGEVADLIEALRNGVSLFIEPRDGEPVPDSGIGLSGSLNAINQALYFCAPRMMPEATER